MSTDSVPQTTVVSSVLVQCAKSDREGENAAEIAVFADLVKIRAIPTPSKDKRPQAGSGRKSITHFTRKSRKNMLERLAMTRNVNNAYFVTLTYPGRFIRTPKIVKRDLAVLRKAMTRRWPTHGAIWRLELKTRKSGESAGQLVPHFHILIFNVEARSVPLLRQWIRHTWTRIVIESDEGKLLRTQAEIVKSRRHAASYVSKYAAKDEDDLIDTTSQLELWGRRWGTWGNLDMSPSIVVQVPVNQLVEVKRLLRAWLKSRGSNYHYRLRRGSKYHGCSCFGLGDISNLKRPGIENATITRMIIAAFA